ncbi:MAG: hypothetical protein IM547_01595 [Chitinophagaceae bacterium]|jgi:hypothetical protein|nr:hypothetical protein [Chitinophagaceae bacterium]
MIIEHAIAPLGGGWLIYRKNNAVYIRDPSKTSFKLHTETEQFSTIIFLWEYLNALELEELSEDPEYLPPVIPINSLRHLRQACVILDLTLKIVKDE